MAKKTRKQKQRAATRRPTAPLPARPQAVAEPAPARSGDSASAAEPALTAATPAADTSPSGARRRVERVAPAVQQRAARPGRLPSTAAAMLQPLESDDAAIPFDRVPYVPADLRRVGIMAAFMIVLIIVAAIIVSNVVH